MIAPRLFREDADPPTINSWRGDRAGPMLFCPAPLS
jgi:hypothetical protein